MNGGCCCYLRGWCVGRAERRVIFTSGSAVDKEEEEREEDRFVGVSVPSHEIPGGHQPCSSLAVLPCSSDIEISAASGGCDTKDSPGQ